MIQECLLPHVSFSIELGLVVTRYIETRQVSREHPMNASRTFAYEPRRHAQEHLTALHF
jgi:hypothetical protein